MHSLAPLLDEVGVGVLLQTLGDVVADLDQTLPGVLQLLALRQALLGPVQLLQRRLHRPHSLLALRVREKNPKTDRSARGQLGAASCCTTAVT